MRSVIIIICVDTLICVIASSVQKTLEEIILRRVRPGTHIITDCWAGYNGLVEKGDDIYFYVSFKMFPYLGYSHSTVNHSRHFKDPVTGTHSNTIEGRCILFINSNLIVESCKTC